MHAVTCACFNFQAPIHAVYCTHNYFSICNNVSDPVGYSSSLLADCKSNMKFLALKPAFML